jgi:hypothetical protein
VKNLLVGESVLPELGHEESHLGHIATKQIGEDPKQLHHFGLANLVVQVKQIECFLDGALQVNTHQFGAVKN